jgi:hypothetical protein
LKKNGEIVQFFGNSLAFSAKKVKWIGGKSQKNDLALQTEKALPPVPGTFGRTEARK